MRKKLYDVLDEAEENNKLSQLYDCLMLFMIAISLVPLFFKQDNIGFVIIDTGW